MFRGPRGGNNRRRVDENFFKDWSPSMAYILGFVFADGAILDSRKSSRTCYLSITINDRCLLEEIKHKLASMHKVITIPPEKILIKNKYYINSEKYKLRIGNMEIFQDLINLGVRPRKSLTMLHPYVPNEYYKFFLRGCFDGDGCLSTYYKNGQVKPRVKPIFTSGSLKFLTSIPTNLNRLLNIRLNKTYWNSGAYRLSYSKKEGIIILNYCYEDITASPYLERKYQKFLSIS